MALEIGAGPPAYIGLQGEVHVQHKPHYRVISGEQQGECRGVIDQNRACIVMWGLVRLLSYHL